ncbi:MAG: ribonuclease E/G [Lachnospiraceae bacterium]|nr:ribonuclease E/G [Lachnospiraceae bacterium]
MDNANTPNNNVNNKIVLTRLNLDNMQPATFFAIYENGKAQRVELFYDDDRYDLGNIYVAHVNDLVKNINAAFVEYAPGHKGYLSLEEYHEKSDSVFFTNRKNTRKVCQGDNILIQVKKEPIKTKDAVVSTNIEYSGKYIVLTYGKSDISVSSKITDNSIRDVLKKLGESFIASIDFDNQQYPLFTEEIFMSILHGTGIIFRTECGTEEALENQGLIREELVRLFQEFLMIFHKAMSSKGRTLIKEAQTPIITMTKNALKHTENEDNEVITDSKEIFDTLASEGIKARLYLDELLPLYKLYSVESVLNEIISKKIWLKSGGYLIIEYTEAMTVIDVNTGKCDQGKDKEKTIMKINTEAADEILRQLRLRNISGIIIVDFIDMKSEDFKSQLMRQLKSKAAKDQVRTTIVDMTRLNLVEITRKKIRERIIIKKS